MKSSPSWLSTFFPPPRRSLHLIFPPHDTYCPIFVFLRGRRIPNDSSQGLPYLPPPFCFSLVPSPILFRSLSWLMGRSSRVYSSYSTTVSGITFFPSHVPIPIRFPPRSLRMFDTLSAVFKPTGTLIARVTEERLFLFLQPLLLLTWCLWSFLSPVFLVFPLPALTGPQ